MVAALDTLWTDDEPEYHGEFYDFDPVWSYPKPHQRPRPPLLAATTGPKATRDCLAWADGWLPGDAAFRNVPKAVADFRRTAEEAGRDPATLDLTIMVWRRAYAGDAGRPIAILVSTVPWSAAAGATRTIRRDAVVSRPVRQQ